MKIFWLVLRYIYSKDSLNINNNAQRNIHPLKINSDYGFFEFK